MGKRSHEMSSGMTAQARHDDDSCWRRLGKAWVEAVEPDKGGLRKVVQDHFRNRQSVDRDLYRQALKDGLDPFVQHNFLTLGDFDDFDLYAFEYQSLYSRIMGESPLPESMLFLFRDPKAVTDEECEYVEDRMSSAYGQELAYLSLIPRTFRWFQVVYSVDKRYEVDWPGISIVLDPSLLSPKDLENPADWSARVRSELRASADAEFNRRYSQRAVGGSSKAELAQLADMISATPFMTLTRFNQTQDSVRSVLYFPAYLHGDRLGGAVLMGNSVVTDASNIEVLQISTQVLLANLRLVEFPEEIQRAEKEVVQRQLVRRFRHNLLHPLGEVMDATRRFKESFEQILAVFDKGIESWKPDLMPNYVKKFLTYIAGEYNTTADSVGEEGGRGISDSDETGVRFKVDVVGDEHVDRFDRTILAEVLGNLFLNTRRYAAPKPGFKGVRLTAGKAAGDQIVYEEIGGPGLPPQVAGDPWRLHPRDATVDASSGQGLFMAKRLMDIHGGKLSYAPSKFGGCCFKIELREDAHDGAEHSERSDHR